MGRELHFCLGWLKDSGTRPTVFGCGIGEKAGWACGLELCIGEAVLEDRSHQEKGGIGGGPRNIIRSVSSDQEQSVEIGFN